MTRTVDPRVLQMEANARAWLRHYMIDAPPVLAVMTDRVVFRSDDRMILGVVRLALAGMMVPWNLGITAHKEAVGVGGGIAKRGWRERVARESAQIIEFENAIGMDFDRWNPDMGAGPGLLHGIEALWPGRTDPFKVRKGLAKRGVVVGDVRKAA